MSHRGRPREFDAEAALDRAVDVFCQYGYEGASVSELTQAMAINRPSLYAAFGSKEDLFRKAVARSAEVNMAYVREALERPTAYQVAEALLRRQIQAMTQPGRPSGCLSVQGGVSAGPMNAGVAKFLAASRMADEAVLTERFARAVQDGDLPEGTDPAVLARFLHVVQEGQAIHAAAGVGRELLEQSAEVALRAIPGGPARADRIDRAS
jgi:AcrR family transcriptional regulator